MLPNSELTQQKSGELKKIKVGGWGRKKRKVVGSKKKKKEKKCGGLKNIVRWTKTPQYSQPPKT